MYRIKQNSANYRTYSAFIKTRNLRLYHYANNNPVRYEDPNGRFVINNSNQYILIRTENSGYVVLPPKTIYTGKNVVDSNGKKMRQIDGGKIDGVILSSGTTFKVSDTKYMLFEYVSLTINQNEQDGKISVNYSSDKDKELSIGNYNLKLTLKGVDDPPGEGKVGTNRHGGNWLGRAPTQDELKELVRFDKNNNPIPTFIDKKTAMIHFTKNRKI